MKIKNKIIISLTLSTLMIFMGLSFVLADESPWQNLTTGIETGPTGTVHNCSPLTVANGTVAAYPDCTITCNSGYTKSGNTCIAQGGGGGGGSSVPPSSVTGAINAMGGVVTLNPEDGTLARFTAPANAFTSATTITITRVSNTASTYTPPASSTGLFMIGSYVYQITALSGSTAVTTFGQPVTLTFTYTAAQIPAGVLESTLQIYYFDTTTNTWVAITSTVDPLTHTITATINHLTQFGIFGKKTAAAEITAEVTPPTTGTVAQLQATLNSLIAQLKVLIKAAIAKGITLSPALMAYVQEAPTITGKITRDWYMGQSGDEVKIIQTLLAQDPAIYPEAKITGYFGSLTKAAVKKFQAKYGINTTGNVGPLTREKMNSLIK